MVGNEWGSVFKDNSALQIMQEGERAPPRLWVLIDADALVSLVKEDDINHNKVCKQIERLQREPGAQFSRSVFTIAETATVLSHKVSHEAAKSFLIELPAIDIDTVR